jgi:hypothetical protein
MLYPGPHKDREIRAVRCIHHQSDPDNQLQKRATRIPLSNSDPKRVHLPCAQHHLSGTLSQAHVPLLVPRCMPAALDTEQLNGNVEIAVPSQSCLHPP